MPSAADTSDGHSWRSPEAWVLYGLIAFAPLAIGTSRKRILAYIGASWFVTVGLAGNAVMALASIWLPSATGVVIARDQRKRASVTPDEVRDRLRERLQEAESGSAGEG